LIERLIYPATSSRRNEKEVTVIAQMSPEAFRAFYRMNCTPYMWAMKNPNGNELLEQKHTDCISEHHQAAAVMLAYIGGREYNPITLVYFYPEMKSRIAGGDELFKMATGASGVLSMPRSEFKALVETIGKDAVWLSTNRLEKAARVIEELKQRGYQCRLSPEALNAGMDKQKYCAQGPDDYLDFILAFHSALAKMESEASLASQDRTCAP